MISKTDKESLLNVRNNLRVYVKYNPKGKGDPNLTAAMVALDAVIQRCDNCG